MKEFDEMERLFNDFSDHADAMFDQDPGYQEWSETIEQQNRQAQDEEMKVIDLSDKSWPSILTNMLGPFN